MNQAVPSADALRAERLARYLREDPRNPALLADACDAALAAGLHDDAAANIAAAEALGLEPAAWTFRRARLCIVQRKLADATRLLHRVQAIVGEHPGVAHDLAYVHLLQGDYPACRALLAPWLADDAGAAEDIAPETLEAVQVLWLRASHRLQLLEQAWAWLEQQLARGLLRPAGCGVASLIALDLERFDAARALADRALADRPLQLEALVARACVALAERDTGRAIELLETALQCNPEDGRAWSALGLCSLQANELPLAQARFERALRSLETHIGTWHALGWSRLLQQDTAGALQAFRQALQLDRNFAESHGAVGLVLAVAGDPAGAEQHLERAHRLDPANVTGRYARALLAGQACDLSRLLALADRLLDRPGLDGAKLGDAVQAAIGPRRR
jgi:tetratricopeptide (TPR) repeat protein